MRDLLQGFAGVELAAAVATRAGLPAGGFQTRGGRRRLVPHDSLGHVVAARAMAGLAAHAFINGKRSQPSPLVVPCEVTLQAFRMLLGIPLDASLPGEIRTLGGAQRRPGASVSAHAPDAVLVAHLGSLVALPAGHRAGVLRTGLLLALHADPARDRAFWQGMRDGFERLLRIDLRGMQDGHMRALLDVAVHALAFGRHHQPSLHRRFAISHDAFRHVLAARTVAALALHAVLDVESLVLFPLLGLGGGSVAAQADGGLLRLLAKPADGGYPLGFGPGQRGVTLAVF